MEKVTASHGEEITFKANIPNKEDPLRARSIVGGTSGGTFEINNPYKPMPNINMTVPARYTSESMRNRTLINRSELTEELSRRIKKYR